mmetsp:Transcript_11140/g.30797  ORF Transcript_11140/g.30797 Transcript_11140/m.30797 type:complete len:218 (-) Transcript_11140:195-848(-)
MINLAVVAEASLFRSSLPLSASTTVPGSTWLGPSRCFCVRLMDGNAIWFPFTIVLLSPSDSLNEPDAPNVPNDGRSDDLSSEKEPSSVALPSSSSLHSGTSGGGSFINRKSGFFIAFTCLRALTIGVSAIGFSAGGPGCFRKAKVGLCASSPTGVPNGIPSIGGNGTPGDRSILAPSVLRKERLLLFASSDESVNSDRGDDRSLESVLELFGSVDKS